MVAYNVWLRSPDLALAQRIARSLRSSAVRALGLAVGGSVQVSMNLVDPDAVGPADVVDAIAASAAIERCELVGLLPHAVLRAAPRPRWGELDLADDRTIEARWPSDLTQ
jgi:glutamate formiminotransferase